MRHLFKLSIAVIVLATLSLTAKADTRFSAYLTGPQDGTASTGTGYGKLTLNAAENSINYTLTYSGLSSNETATHIHGNALPGATAGVLFPINNTGATAGTVSGTFGVTAAQVADLKAGLWYFNVHTVNNGGGEIRGQINPAVNISEFRFRGPNSANNEYVEFYNDSDVSVTVADLAPDGNAGTQDGWAFVVTNNATTPTTTTRFVIPNGTTIPARGHFLAVGAAYALGVATDTITDTAGTVIPSFASIADSSSLALFRTANATHVPCQSTSAPVCSNPTPALAGAYRLDAVGFANTQTQPLFVETTVLPASPTANSTTSDHAYFRKMITGRPQDTDVNSADFQLASTTGTTTGPAASAALGAPGPENLSSPLRRNAELTTTVPLYDGGATKVRYADCGALPARITGAGLSCATPGATLGYLSLRRRIVNNTANNVTRLRFRVVDITTLNYTAGVAGAAQVRAYSAPGEAAGAPYSGLQPTTLETPPTQAIGGGLNSTLSAGVITLGNPLTPGTGIDLEFLLSVETSGTYRFLVNVEALP